MKTLLAIYVVVAWNLHGGPMHRQEFELSLPEIAVDDNATSSPKWIAPHFFSEELCEHYRPALVTKWIQDQHVPYRPGNVVDSYCAPWTPNPNLGTDL